MLLMKRMGEVEWNGQDLMDYARLLNNMKKKNKNRTKEKSEKVRKSEIDWKRISNMKSIY